MFPVAADTITQPANRRLLKLRKHKKADNLCSSLFPFNNKSWLGGSHRKEWQKSKSFLELFKKNGKDKRVYNVVARQSTVYRKASIMLYGEPSCPQDGGALLLWHGIAKATAELQSPSDIPRGWAMALRWREADRGFHWALSATWNDSVVI